ncbi:MAG: hypothetical protein ACK4S4_10170 [Pyrinomonadaceae bacterium]
MEQTKRITVHICLLFAVTSILTLTALPAVGQSADLAKLLADASVDTQRGAVLEYSYQLRVYYKRHKFGGRKFTRIYEAILPSRLARERNIAHPLILISDSEYELSTAYIQREREEAAARLLRLETEGESGKVSEGPADDGGYWSIAFGANEQKVRFDILSLLRSIRPASSEQAQWNGRPVTVVVFAPAQDATLEPHLRYLSKIQGQIWIDNATRRIFRVEGYPAGSFDAVRAAAYDERAASAVLRFEQTLVSGRYWFPSVARLNFAGHPEIYDEIELEFAFSNYRKASVDVEYRENTSTTEGSLQH